MLRLNASAFYNVMSVLNTIAAVVNAGAEIGSKLGVKGDYSAKEQRLPANAIGNAKEQLSVLHKELIILGTSLAALSTRRLLVQLHQPEPPTHRDFVDGINDIHARLRDELSLVCTLVITPDRVKFFEPKEPVFGQDVIDRLPLAVPDIEDASKCLALNQGTAAVFHLMRVMEAALKRLAAMLGIPYAPSWESYIKQINDKIAAKHKTKGVKWKKDEPFYRDIIGDLQTIKIAWRNPTMHIVRRYSADEAEEIFRAVRGFLIRLAPKLPKQVVGRLSESDLWPASPEQSS